MKILIYPLKQENSFGFYKHSNIRKTGQSNISLSGILMYVRDLLCSLRVGKTIDNTMFHGTLRASGTMLLAMHTTLPAVRHIVQLYSWILLSDSLHGTPNNLFCSYLRA